MTDIQTIAGWERETVDRGITDRGVTLTERIVNTSTITTAATVTPGAQSLQLYVGPVQDGRPWGAPAGTIHLTADMAESLAARLADGARNLRMKGL